MYKKTSRINILPKMIIFDYGHTLLYEPDWNPLHGIEALMPYVSKNPDNLTAEDIISHFEYIFLKRLGEIKRTGYDIPGYIAAKFFLEYLRIELSIPYSQAEAVFWNAETPGAKMPGVSEMLSSLYSLGIKTAVISNLTMSGKGLSERISRLIPESKMEFVITSGDYMFRKPDPMIFRLAIKKSGLAPEKIWFCGDNPNADIEGAAGVGIFPVWYDSSIECPYRDKEREVQPSCNMLHIRHWSELTDFLQSASEK